MNYIDDKPKSAISDPILEPKYILQRLPLKLYQETFFF